MKQTIYSGKLLLGKTKLYIEFGSHMWTDRDFKFSIKEGYNQLFFHIKEYYDYIILIMEDEYFTFYECNLDNNYSFTFKKFEKKY